MDTGTIDPKTLNKPWGWYLVYGIILFIAGIFLLGAPVVATLFTAFFFGIMLIVQGVAYIIHAFASRDKGYIWSVIFGILSIIVGIMLVAYPLSGAIGFTLIIAIMLIVGGILKIIHSFHLKPHSGWGAMLANGIIALILGIMIYSEWPASGLWIIGMFLGIDAIIAGFVWISASLALKRAK